MGFKQGLVPAIFNKVFNPVRWQLSPWYCKDEYGWPIFAGLPMSKIISMITFTCPRCHKGKLFKKRNAYSRGMAEMNKVCPHCSELFEKEPGFYYGAAYVSYALTVALWVAVFVALITFDALGLISFTFFDNPITFIVVGVVTLLILLPLIYRLSRSIWIHLFVGFRKDAVGFNEAKRRDMKEIEPKGD